MPDGRAIDSLLDIIELIERISRQVVGLRNVLAHQYFVRESDLIWETVTVGLPRLAEVCRRELRRLGWTADPPAAPVP
ncbi:MAG: DUF86 domain-containing protein [Magnetospirillum sp.]|nr:DUF86 domain-containing protein [Magnetospirillum sp.]